MATTYNFGKKINVAQVMDGTYNVKLVQMTEPKEEDDFYNPGQKVTKSRFTFQVTNAGEFNGAELSSNVSVSATGPKSNFYKIVEALMGQKPEEIGEISDADLLGKTCRVTVVVKEGTDGLSSYSNITGFFKMLQTGQGTARQAAQAGANGKPKPAQVAAAVAETEEEDDLFL